MTSPLTSSRTSLSIGGATYDLFLTMDESAKKQEDNIVLAAGGKLRVKRVIETCGGGACNTAIGLSRLGISAGFCGVVGSDQWGEKLLRTMKEEGVSVASATIVEHETSSFSIILSLPSGERTILYTPGVNEHLHDVTFDVGAIAKADVVYLNHLSDTSCVIEDDIIHAILKSPRVHLTWNPGGCQISTGIAAPDKKALLQVTDLLLLNKEEAMHFSGTDTIPKALTALHAAGAKHVCITDGKNGTHATDGTKTYHCPILPDVTVIDTTGAGDAFGTGAAWALSSGESLPIALIAGTLNAASVVGALGAQAGLLTEHHMRDRLTSHPLSVSEIS